MAVTILTDCEEEGIRLARRQKLDTEVVLSDPDGHGEVTLPCCDVSVSGVFVYSSVCVRPGSEFICKVPMDDGSVVEASGTVSRVVLNEDEPSRSGMGIRFTRLAREARERILEFTLPRESALTVS
jgi:hypothetical protein